MTAPRSRGRLTLDSADPDTGAAASADLGVHGIDGLSIMDTVVFRTVPDRGHPRLGGVARGEGR